MVLAMAAVSAAFCQSSGDSLPVKVVKGSGIKGKVLLTGNCPGPQRIENPCPSRPYQGPLAIRSATGEKLVATTKSNRFGEFSVVVPPGKYFITQAGEAKYPIIHSSEIKVRKNKFTTVEIQGDLGMR